MPNFDNLVVWANSCVESWLFYLVAILAIPLAFGVIFDRVIVRSGFMLIGVFGAVSVIFLLLRAQFLALAQVMIYAVGITLVVVIALMLTNPRMEKELSPALPAQKGGGVAVAIIMFLTIYLAIRQAQPFWGESAHPVQNDATWAIGVQLMQAYCLPFEFASVLLLVALIGAVMMARSEGTGLRSVEPEPEEKGRGAGRVDDAVQV